MELGFTVTNPQLLATKYVTLIFIGILVLGMILNVRQLFNAELYGTRIRKFIFTALLASGIYPVFRIYQVESSLLASNKYVPGITTGYCEVFALGNGVAFEYKVNGITYKGCDTYHPISKDSITVPHGKYYVRYAEDYPAEGRIDLNKPVTKDEKDKSTTNNQLEASILKIIKPNLQ